MTTNTTYRKMKQERDLALAECERLRADLRDTFAGLAMQAIVADENAAYDVTTRSTAWAEKSYVVADAMLAARAKP